MKNLFLTFVCFAALLTVSCKDDEDTNISPQNYFEFIVEDTIYPNYKTFIILNSEDGEVIKCQEIFQNQTCRFDLPEYTGKEKYIVQKMEVAEQRPYWSIDCFLDVKPQSWHFTKFKYYYIEMYPPPIKKPSQIGNETIVFTKDLMVPSPEGNRVPIYSFANRYDSYWNTEINDSTFVLKQYCNPDNIFIALRDNNNTPLYKWINNVELNASLSLSRHDFDAVTDSMNITFPSNINCSAKLMSEDDPSTEFENYGIFSGSIQNSNVLKVFLPKDMFSGYWSTLICQISETSDESFTKRRDPIPNSFKQMDADMKINSFSFSRFSATTTGNADFGELSWKYFLDGSFEYNVVGSLNSISNFVAPKIPDSLNNVYNIPFYILDHPSSVNFALFENDVYEGFDDYIQDIFVKPGDLMKRVNEYHTKVVYWRLNHPWKKLKTEELEMIDEELQKSY